MINCPRSWSIEEYKDVKTINSWKIYEEEQQRDRKGGALERGLDSIQRIARDHARTPFQWDDTPQAGFSVNPDTWMKTMDSFEGINVREQEGRAGSVLEFYKGMLRLRKEYSDVLVEGKFQLLDEGSQATMSYLKLGQKRIAFVVLNFSKEEREIYRGHEVAGVKTVLLSSINNPEDVSSDFLGPYEARIYLLQNH